MVAGDWGIRANDLLLDNRAVCKDLRKSSGDGDVLANWETEDGGWGWEGESVDGCVVGEDGLFSELEVLEFLLEDWFRSSLCA